MTCLLLALLLWKIDSAAGEDSAVQLPVDSYTVSFVLP